MARGFVHTVRRGEQWVNEVEGEGVIRGIFDRKKDAVAAGRERAREDKTEHLIHNMNGQISDRYSYGGDDPRRPG